MLTDQRWSHVTLSEHGELFIDVSVTDSENIPLVANPGVAIERREQKIHRTDAGHGVGKMKEGGVCLSARRPYAGHSPQALQNLSRPANHPCRSNDGGIHGTWKKIFPVDDCQS